MPHRSAIARPRLCPTRSALHSLIGEALSVTTSGRLTITWGIRNDSRRPCVIRSFIFETERHWRPTVLGDGVEPQTSERTSRTLGPCLRKAPISSTANRQRTPTRTSLSQVCAAAVVGNGHDCATKSSVANAWAGQLYRGGVGHELTGICITKLGFADNGAT